MLRRVFCGAQGATLALATTATMLADVLTKALVHYPSLLAAMNAPPCVFVTSDSSTSVRTTLPPPSDAVPAFKKAIGSELLRQAKAQPGSQSVRVLTETIRGQPQQFFFWIHSGVDVLHITDLRVRD